ncbi:MAG TPA: hypothetical protein DCE41_12550 [Cytophagales bacterium]|nr:hypothetical protein [Cytophagales bacterium]HAA24343.1 hypothetical protein [Cytophagales bacterium]HAP62872.1 hypothetical protein [Cytophagales bacterium]
MTNLEIIQQLKTATFTDEDGEDYALEFHAGLTDQAIRELQAQFPNQTLAPELQEILTETRGWVGYGPEMVAFDSIDEFGFDYLIPHSITLGHDGFGNFWVLDLDSQGTPGKVYYACHDPAVLVIHSQSLNEYLQHLLAFYQGPEKNHLNEVHDDTVWEVWKSLPNASPKQEFLESNPDFNRFLEAFEGENWTVADLRMGQNKLGFAWGKFGFNQKITRHPTELVWVIENKKEKSGLKGLKRLFGRS